MAPHTIAASTAASARPNETASSANEPEAIATIPAASASIPSIRFTRLARNATQRSVSGTDAQPMSWSPRNGRVTCSIRRSQPSTGISATIVTVSSFMLGRSPWMSS